MTKSLAIAAIRSRGAFLLRTLKNNVDVAAIQAWMDKYCKEHPLDNINDAFQILALELIKRTKE